MNKIVLLGKLIRDPELRTLEDGSKAFTRFIIAVDRNFKAQDGTRKADLIPVTLWGRKAEVVCQYLRKVVAEDFKFVGNRRSDKENNSVENNLDDLATN